MGYQTVAEGVHFVAGIAYKMNVLPPQLGTEDNTCLCLFGTGP